jgi:hypothetical protein
MVFSVPKTALPYSSSFQQLAIPKECKSFALSSTNPSRRRKKLLLTYLYYEHPDWKTTAAVCLVTANKPSRRRHTRRRPCPTKTASPRLLARPWRQAQRSLSTQLLGGTPPKLRPSQTTLRNMQPTLRGSV